MTTVLLGQRRCSATQDMDSTAVCCGKVYSKTWDYFRLGSSFMGKGVSVKCLVGLYGKKIIIKTPPVYCNLLTQCQVEKNARLPF